jgi:DNA-binding NarL/FixJ family response regulator
MMMGATPVGPAVSMPSLHPWERCHVQVGTANMGVALILADHDLKPLYIDSQSHRILTYPDAALDSNISFIEVQRRLRRALGTERYSAGSRPTVLFLSGRRRYVCWSVDIPAASAVAFLLEREHGALASALSDASGRFNLNQRETETVQHLVHGLTTKAIALRTDESANTLKQSVV